MAESDVEMGQDPSSTAETSRAGAERMRRMLSPPKLNGLTRSIIYPQDSQLLYSTPSSSPYSGHLVTPLFKHTPPRPLLPPSLPPSTLISTSYAGEWLAIFHPSQDLSILGGLIAVYPSSILSTASKNPNPAYSFPLPQTPLASQHLYPPRQYLANGKRSDRAGPSRPKDYRESLGPAFVVLLPTTVVLFHYVSQMGNQPTSQGSLSVLSAPLKTRFHATAGGDRPVESSVIDRGWMGIVEGDEGVWVGWEERGDIGVTRLEVKMLSGNLTLSSVPMPSLPRNTWSVSESTTTSSVTGNASTVIKSEVQGMIFIRIPAESLKAEEEETKSNPDARCVIGASVIYSDTVKSDSFPGPHHAFRSKIEVVGFERREVMLVDGFTEIGSGNSDDQPSPAWDWFTIPKPISQSTSPLNHSIVSISPTPLTSSSITTTLTSSPKGLQLIYLNLCPAFPEWDFQVIANIPNQGRHDLEIIHNPSVQRGSIGLIAIISPVSGARLVVAPAYRPSSSVEKEEGVAEGLKDMVRVTSRGIIASVNQGIGYGDLIRAFVGSVKLAEREEATLNLLKEGFQLLENDLHVDEYMEIHKLQIALLSSIEDPRYALSTEILRLYEISEIFSSCRLISDNSISYHLNSIWSLVPVAEWASYTLSKIFRDISISKSAVSWTQSSSSTSLTDYIGEQISPRLIYMLLPSLRFLILQILGYLKEFKQFVLDKLDKPVIQPESRFSVVGKIPDPRATILVKERIKDLGESQGLDIDLWGNALDDITKKRSSSEEVKVENAGEVKERELNLLLNMIINLSENGNFELNDLKTLVGDLPDSASLFLDSDPDEDRRAYDAITFNPILSVDTKGQMGSERFKCDRCSWRTVSLGYETPSLDLNVGMGSIGMNSVDDLKNGWTVWRKMREKGCGCGGLWLRD